MVAGFQEELDSDDQIAEGSVVVAAADVLSFATQDFAVLNYGPPVLLVETIVAVAFNSRMSIKTVC